MGTCWVAALPSWCRNRWCIPDALPVCTSETARTRHDARRKRESARARCNAGWRGTREGRDLGELHESVVAGHGVRLRPAVVVMEKRARAVVLLLDGERGRAASPHGGEQLRLSTGALALVATVRVVVVGGVPVRVVAAPASVALPTRTTATTVSHSNETL
jgi:hypothetical protein